MSGIFNPLARAIRWLVVLISGYDLFLRRTVFKTRYRLDGQCRKCGQCCELIGINDPENHCRIPWLKNIFIAYYHYTCDFNFVEHRPEERVLLFTCPHYNPVSHQCDTHPYRPAICRGYPRIPFFEKPEVFEACGYRVGEPRGECL